MKSQPSDGNLLSALYRSVFSRSEAGAAARDAYFTPRIADADRQLEALSARIRGSYRRGALDWSALVGPEASTSTPDIRESGWGRGSQLRKTMHGMDIELSFGVESMSSVERGSGAPSQSVVLAPGVTVKASARNAPLALGRHDVRWSIEEEAASGADRLRLLRERGDASAAAVDALPPALAKARARLIEKAARITTGSDHVFAVGRPAPRAPGEPREFARGNFDADALIDLIERARALAHALATV